MKAFRHSGFGFHSDFWFRHSDFRGAGAGVAAA